jgi:hypothetical protein
MLIQQPSTEGHFIPGLPKTRTSTKKKDEKKTEPAKKTKLCAPMKNPKKKENDPGRRIRKESP